METVPYVRGSDTSEAAADSMKHAAPTDEARVLTMIQANADHGATDDEVEARLGMLHQNASARRKALVDKGKVRDSGQRRRTRSGRYATVWIAGVDPNPIHGATIARRTIRPSIATIQSAVEAIGATGVERDVPSVNKLVVWLRDIVQRESVQ